MVRKALVVDDSMAVRRMQQRTLESLGWQVYTASNGKKALGALRVCPDCTLVLTDWHMPEMDGLQFVRAVRSEPDFEGLRVVMVTSESNLNSVQLALEAGADELIMKPVSSDLLGERLAEILDE